MEIGHEKVTTADALFPLTRNALAKVCYRENVGLQAKLCFFNCVKKVMLWQTVFLVLTGWKSDGNITYQLKTRYQVKFAYLSFKKVFIILGKLHLWLLGVVWVLAAGNARRDYVQLGVEGTIYPASEAGISLWRHCFFTDCSYSSV